MNPQRRNSGEKGKVVRALLALELSDPGLLLKEDLAKALSEAVSCFGKSLLQTDILNKPGQAQQAGSSTNTGILDTSGNL